MPMAPHAHLVVRCAVLLYEGRLVEAESLARAEYERAVAEGLVEAQGLFAGELARTLVQRGAPASAIRAGREAVAVLRQRKSPFFLRLTLIPLAHAFALRGDTAAATSTLAEIDALGLPRTMVFGPELLQARAWNAVAAGDVDGACRLLWEAVELSEAGGELAMQAGALHDLIRLGRVSTAAGPLCALAEALDGPLVRACQAHASSSAAEDASGIERSSTSFEEIGADLLAAEAAVDAATAWRKAGAPRRAAAAEQRAHALLARCEGATTPALSAVGVRSALTARELEIARLAAAGVSNREIAARLHLSLHTVQNKLHAVYEKLGVEGRRDLRSALSPS